ncbi:MAG: methyltransferase domain-containing protein [Chloroflexi bacterium]|nr:MAG: methyltransferase domain-containing protein [Chloroflexota bacterium]
MPRQNPSKNLLIVTENFLFGGLETQISGQIEQLTRRGWKVHVICGKNYSNSDLLSEAASVLPGITLDIHPELADFKRAINTIRKIIREKQISIIHAHPFGSILPAYVASQEERIPMALTLHGPSSINTGMGSFFESLVGEVIKNSYTIAVSPEIKNIAEQRFGVDVAILPNSISRVGGQLKMPSESMYGSRWLIGSRLDKDKVYGIKHFIILAHELGVIRIDIAGDGDQKSELEDWCTEKGYVNTYFLGRVDNLMSVMSNYDGCAGMGRFVLESLEAGRPTCLVGYDGVKGIINSSEFLKIMSEANFSGRNIDTIGRGELANSYNIISTDVLRQLRCAVRVSYSERRIWSKYEAATRRMVFSDDKHSKLRAAYKNMSHSYNSNLTVDSFWGDVYNGVYMKNNRVVNSEEYWDNRFNKDWDENHGREQSKFFMSLMADNLPEWLISKLNSNKVTVCDWGCAEGDGTSVFASKFKKASFTGIDFAESAIMKADSNYKSKNLSFKSVDLLKAKSKLKFDIILASNILEHFHQPWDIFDKISKFSSDTFVVMVPFKEDPKNLHFEHFHSFQENDFLLDRNEWRLVHFNVINTSRISGSKWNGYQAVAVYTKATSESTDMSRSVADICSNREQTQQATQDDSSDSSEKIKTLEYENEDLKSQITAITSSKRFVAVNSFADGIHKIVKRPYATTRSMKGKLSSYMDESIQERLKSKIINSGYFDPVYYLETYTDVNSAGIDPMEHFIDYGWKELRNPSASFDSAYYARVNSLDLDGEVSQNPLLHYLKRRGRSDDQYSVDSRNLYEQRIKDSILKNERTYRHIVIIESMSWSGSLQQRPHHLARLLARRGVLVIYVDSDNYKTKLIEEVQPNLYLLNDKDSILEFANAKIKNKYYWLFSTTPKDTSELKRLVSAGYDLAYDYIDDFDEHISGDIKVQLANYKLLNKLDVKILSASAKNLRAQLQDKLPGKKVLLCQNAVDMDHFDYKRLEVDSSIPADMVNILHENKPIVGYYGAMAPWIDYSLINNLTEIRSDLNFVFLGIDYNDGLKNLDIRPNVHFLGPKDYFKLQDYAKLFDCAIIPFEKGDIAKSTSPVKLFEYMAMGLPTVCTRDLNECKGYDFVYMSKNDKEFEENVDIAIKQKKSTQAREKLVEQAKKNTWSARVDDIFNEMELINREIKK